MSTPQWSPSPKEFDLRAGFASRAIARVARRADGQTAGGVASSGSVLHTSRLRLEPIARPHADLLFEGLRDERLYAFTDDGPPVSVEALRARYATLAGGTSPDGSQRWLNWVVFAAEDDRCAGYVQATVAADVAEIAYLLLREHWGKGYAREAVAAMLDHLRARCGVRTAWARVDARNVRSVALLVSLGFARVREVPADETEYRLALLR